MSSRTREFEVYASGARTATPDATNGLKTFSYDGYVACHIIIVTSSVTSTPSVVPSIQGIDGAGNVYDVLVGAAIATTGTVVLKVGPGIGVIANGAAADYLPYRWRLLMTHGNTNSITYAVRAMLFGGNNG